MIHCYLVDFNNSGDMYRISIKGIRQEITNYLYTISNDTRYIKSYKKQHKNDKGNRAIPCGVVVACSFEYCKFDTFSKFASKLIDARKAVIA